MNEVSGTTSVDEFSLADSYELENGASDDLRARVKTELEPGERLLWAARCEPPVERRGAGFYVARVITLCLLGLGIVLIRPPRAIQHWNDGSAMTGGILCLGIAFLFIIVLTMNWSARRRQRRRMTNTCYAVTDRRAVIWAPEPATDAIRVETLVRGQIRKLVRIERPDRFGSLELAGKAWDDGMGYYNQFTIAHVCEVRRVEQIVRNNLMTTEQSARVN